MEPCLYKLQAVDCGKVGMKSGATLNVPLSSRAAGSKL